MEQSVHLRLVALVCLCGLIPASSLAAMPAWAAEPPVADVAPIATNAATIAYTADVAALIAASPEGGPELEAALSALIATQPDGAMAVAIMMIAVGDKPALELVATVSRVIKKAAFFTTDELSKAVADAVAASPNPTVAAVSIITVVALLPAPMQVAAGGGLAVASATLASSGNAPAATTITALITSTGLPALVEAFQTTTNTLVINSIKNNQKQDKLSEKWIDTVPETPASAS